MDKFNVRDVNDREIYESYMGILRISPNEIDSNTSGKINDNTTQMLTDTNDCISLSDSDGNVLGLSFTPRIFETSIKRGSGGIEDCELINIQSNVKNTIFAVNTINIRSTLSLTAENEVSSPIHAYSYNGSYLTGLFYPTNHAFDKDYFNRVTNAERPLLNDLDGVPYNGRAQQRDDILQKKDKTWYDTINPAHYVKVGGKVIYQLNVNNESVPVLYTHDKILAHGHGASYSTSNSDDDGIRVPTEKNIKESLILSKDGNKGYATHLCWADIDKLVWDSLENALQGDLRQVSGRYTTLGASVDRDIRGDLGIDFASGYSLASNNALAYTLKETAPLVGLDVPAGNIIYNAMPVHRYFFYLGKQTKYNISKDESITTKSTLGANFNNLGDSAVSAFAARDKHFAANLSKNFVLCDGNSVSIENYPALNLENDFIDYETGELKETAGEGTIYHALLKSDIGGKKDKIYTLPLINFNTKSSIFLRGATWIRTNKSDNDVLVKEKNNFGRTEPGAELSSGPELKIPTSYKYAIEKGGAIYDKLVKENTLYSFSIAHKLSAYKHRHRIFSSASGLVGDGRDITKDVGQVVLEPMLKPLLTLYTSTIRSILHKHKIRTEIEESHEKEIKMMGTDNEFLPVMCVGHNVVCRKSRTPEGFWLYYTGMPLNYVENTVVEFKNADANDLRRLTNATSYNSDRTRYLMYSSGARKLYWGNKPIKNRAFVCLCNNNNKLSYIDGKAKDSYVIGDTNYIGGDRKIEYNAFLKLMNEAESRMPAALQGGWPRLALLNGWTQREGKNSHLHKHETKAYSNYVLTGGYKIGSLDEEKAKSKVEEGEKDDLIKPICLTSLEISDPEKIGLLKNGVSTSSKETGKITESDLATYNKTTESITINGKKISVYSTEPSPGNINLIPLMRI